MKINAAKIKRPIRIEPTSYERELIALMMEKLRGGGFESAVLPKIYISFETPPLFISYPFLEEEKSLEWNIFPPVTEEMYEREGREKPGIKEEGRPEYISIEEFLGVYYTTPKIVLFARGFDWSVINFGFEEELLKAVVLIHEISHWVTHLLPAPSVPEWEKNSFHIAEREVKEGWAQLITWWIVDEIGGELKNTFLRLNMGQSHPYRVFEYFKNYQVKELLLSLMAIRRHSYRYQHDYWRFRDEHITLDLWKDFLERNLAGGNIRHRF